MPSVFQSELPGGSIAQREIVYPGKNRLLDPRVLAEPGRNILIHCLESDGATVVIAYDEPDKRPETDEEVVALMQKDSSLLLATLFHSRMLPLLFKSAEDEPSEAAARLTLSHWDVMSPN